jgi:threonine synthase
MGMYKGFKEMLEDGRIDKIPTLHAVQSEETSPLVAAFEGRAWAAYPQDPKSIAIGISVKSPPRPQVVAAACKATGGSAQAISEELLQGAHRQLAEMEGILVEPTSAAALAGVKKLRDLGLIVQGETVLIPLTGFGLKEPLP